MIVRRILLVTASMVIPYSPISVGSAEVTQENSIVTVDNDLSSQAPVLIIGDNIDKDIAPRNMRVDHQKRSLHYFNMCAIKDRVSTSGLAEHHETIPPLYIQDFLPSTDDYNKLQSNFAVIVTRILCKT